MALALASLTLAAVTPVLSDSKILSLRGGMNIGPINGGNFDGGLKVAAAITAAGAITSKYAGIEETSLTKMFQGAVWNTNLIVSMVTGATSTVLYSMQAQAAFNVAKLTAVLWLASALMDLKHANWDVNNLMDNKVQTALAGAATVLAFA